MLRDYMLNRLATTMPLRSSNYLDYMENMFKAGKTQSEVLAGLKSLHDEHVGAVVTLGLCFKKPWRRRRASSSPPGQIRSPKPPRNVGVEEVPYFRPPKSPERVQMPFPGP